MSHPLASIMGNWLYIIWGRGCRPYGPPSLPSFVGIGFIKTYLKVHKKLTGPIVTRFHLMREGKYAYPYNLFNLFKNFKHIS